MALFVEVLKARGLRHAAEAVGMPNSTVSRRISALEKAIGLRLGRPPDSTPIARQLAYLPCHLCASPRYLERSGWTLRGPDRSVEVSVSGRFQLNSVGLILAKTQRFIEFLRDHLEAAGATGA